MNDLELLKIWEELTEIAEAEGVLVQLVEDHRGVVGIEVIVSGHHQVFSSIDAVAGFLNGLSIGRRR